MRLCCVLLSLLTCIGDLNADDDIGIDYYFGFEPLRSAEPNQRCEDTLFELLCLANCPQDHVCFMRKCLCIDLDNKRGLVKRSRHSDKKAQQDDPNPPGFVDLTKMSLEDDRFYNPKPVLRHHIAHFCPDLEVARECIRTCMPMGKPAFCGKDHVCYCGHQYGKKTVDKGASAKAVYAEFLDLYQKYFGPNFGGGVNTDEESDEDSK